jgi:hypothetical protein
MSAPAIFEGAMHRVLGECTGLGTQRGQEYADSWALENVVTTFTKNTLLRFGFTLNQEQLRLVIAAALVDVKDQRINAGGPWKRDSAIDGINYRALYTDLREEYEANTAESVAPNVPRSEIPASTDRTVNLPHE